MVKIKDKKVDAQRNLRFVVEVIGEGDNTKYLIRIAENMQPIAVSNSQVEFLRDFEEILTTINSIS